MERGDGSGSAGSGLVLHGGPEPGLLYTYSSYCTED